MALQTYTDLQNAIQTWLSRSGDTKLSGSAADLITLAEQLLAYGSLDQQFPIDPLRIRAMETSATLVIGSPVTGSTVGGTANAITLTPQTAISAYSNGQLYQFVATATNSGATTISISGLAAKSLVLGSARSALQGNEIIAGGTYNVYYDGINSVFVLMPEMAHVPLPADYLATRSWYYIWNPGINKPLTYFTPQQLNEIGATTYSSPPEKYTIEADAIRFAPIPDATYYAPMLYYKKFPALATAPGNTNWLMQNAPGVYLNAALFEAKMLLQDDAGMSRYHRRLSSHISSLSGQDDLDRHSGASLTISNLSGNP
jgi:hypothetical protein